MKGGLDGIIYPTPVLSLLASNSVCNVCHPHSSIPLISIFKDKMLHRLVCHPPGGALLIISAASQFKYTMQAPPPLLTLALLVVLVTIVVT